MAPDWALFRGPWISKPMRKKKRVAGRPSRMQRRKSQNLALGIFFFLLGVIGVLVPVLPQVPFFVMSLLFFSLVFPAVRRAMRRFLHRHPKLAHAYKSWRDRARRKRLEIIRKEKKLAEKLHLHHLQPRSSKD